jgi:hypothetical protein
MERDKGKVAGTPGLERGSQAQILIEIGAKVRIKVTA